MKIRLVIYMLFIGLMLGASACGQLAEQATAEGHSAYASQNYDGALGAYERARNRAPDHAEPLYNLGNTYYSRGDYNEAVARYQTSLRIADDNLTRSGLFNLGNAYFQQRDFESAVEAYKEVLRLDPSDQDTRHNLELAMRQLADDPSVADQAEQDTQQEPDQGRDINQEGQQDTEPEDDIQDDPGQEQAQEEDRGQDDEEKDQGRSDIPQLTEEQAKRLLDAIGQSTETLRGHLHQVFVVSGESPIQDW